MRSPWTVLVVLAALGGCGLQRQALRPTRYYSIDTAPPARGADAAAPAPGVLAIRPLDAASRYRERIFFRADGRAAGYHEHDRWVEPPAEMATTALRRALEAGGVARIVADDRLVRRPDAVLDARLTRFDEVQGDEQWAAECEIELVLKRDDDSVLLATRLAASRPAKEKTTPAFVDAMNGAMAELAANAARAVAHALATAGARPPDSK